MTKKEIQQLIEERSKSVMNTVAAKAIDDLRYWENEITRNQEMARKEIAIIHAFLEKLTPENAATLRRPGQRC